MKATTDSEGSIRFDLENKAGISNLLNIYSAFAGKTIEELERDYNGQGYGAFKKDLVEVMIGELKPIRERFEEIRHSEELVKTLKDGAERANAVAERTLTRVKQALGLETGY